MPDSDLKYRLALHRCPGIGPATFQQLLLRFGSAENTLGANASQLLSLNLKPETIEYLLKPDWESVDRELEWSEEPQHHILTLNDSDYPSLLREIPATPPILYIHGDRGLLQSPQLAIVGSRNPTPNGRITAQDFARHLADVGLTITSGLALGIDAASHLGALESDGYTIAVMGTGLDRVYPARNRDLAHAVAERGALVSEYPLGTTPRPENFPRRNRIISGLSMGTLVVEAALQSGSLTTAHHAVEQGREVFAIPGSIHNPLSRGCHRLIREGAKLVETAEDILSELSALSQALDSPQKTHEKHYDTSESLDQEYERLLDTMGFAPTPVDQLVSLSGLTAEEVSSMLLILELQGYVGSSPGGLYIRVK